MKMAEWLVVSLTANVFLVFLCWLGWSQANLYERAWKKMLQHSKFWNEKYKELAEEMRFRE